MMKLRWFVIFALVFMLFSLLSISCGDDDDSDDSSSGDDDDDDDNDDDNDDNDDDNDDDDTYAAFIPDGKKLGDILGISSHMSKSTSQSWKRDFEINALANAGVKNVRADFHWYAVEPEDDVWNLEGYDTMVNLCNDAGLEVTPILLNTPDWATPGGTTDEIDLNEYGEYADMVASHFGDRVEYYEFWNEENYKRFWKPEPNPAKFGDVMKVAYDSIHTNDPDGKLIYGGLTPMDLHILDPHGVFNFLYRVYEEHPDVCEYFDSMSIHPYTFLQQPGPENGVDIWFYHYPNLVEMVEQVRSILSEIGCPEKPIQFTEVGWPSYIITDNRQAAYLARSLMLAHSLEIEFYDWYTFWDGNPDRDIVTESFFGLYTWPDDTEQTTVKPSYEALVGASQVIGDAMYAGDLGLALEWEPDKHALVFANEEDLWTIGFWHSGGDFYVEKPMTVPLPYDAVGEWTLFDQEGNEISTGDCDQGEVDLNLKGRVGYLQFTREAKAN